MHQIKLAYIGKGSKMWARVFMNDLALSEISSMLRAMRTVSQYEIIARSIVAVCLNARIISASKGKLHI